MERILIGIDTKDIDLRPCIHAINLAERMKRASVYFLLISDTSKKRSGYANKKASDTNMKKALDISAKAKNDLEALIEDGRSRGIIVGYYTAKGDFKNEIINFIKSRRIDLLVIGSPLKKISKDKKNYKEKEAGFTECIKKIQHRVNCRIEVVHGKYEQN